MVYKLKVAGIERELPLCPISDNLNIGAFILFGDVELTEKCAEELCRLAPEHDVMITAESKGIPLIHAMCRISGKNKYVLTKGDNNEVPDNWLYSGEQFYVNDEVETQIVGVLPFVGWVSIAVKEDKRVSILFIVFLVWSSFRDPDNSLI